MVQDPRNLKVSIGAISSAGKKSINQDSYGAQFPTGTELGLKGAAFAIADGITPSNVSHIAAQTAVTSFLSDYYSTSDTWSVKMSGSKVLQATNSWLYGQTLAARNTDKDNRGYVCTFSALVLKNRKAHIFHVGDSRICRIVDGALEQLTVDHRVVMSAAHSYLGRSLGTQRSIEIDYRTVDLAEGDVFIATTDGVHDFLAPQEIASLVSRAKDLDAAAEDVLNAALRNGSDDNVTVLIVKVEDLPDRNTKSVLDELDALPPPQIPKVPSNFDGYQIIRELHANDRSSVFLAKDPETQELVAIKIPSIEMRDDPDYLRRFALEEWVARRLDSPHILKMKPITKGQQTLYVVMEYIEGQSLRQWMLDNPKPNLETVRKIIEQIARGLIHFHRRGMLHQDIRPENILIDKEGTVKIIDFGSTRVAGVVEANEAFDDRQILGTFQYTAPEYFVGYAGTAKSDQFSLGVIAYEMLTGWFPYGVQAQTVKSQKALQELRYIKAQSMNELVPKYVDAALAKATNPDPHKRYESLSEFLVELRQPRAGTNPDKPLPLMKRAPARFWQILCAVQLLIIFFLLTR